jgi:hypothetical protein
VTSAFGESESARNQPKNDIEHAEECVGSGFVECFKENQRHLKNVFHPLDILTTSIASFSLINIGFALVMMGSIYLSFKIPFDFFKSKMSWYSLYDS